MRPKIFDEVPTETFQLFNRIQTAILSLPATIEAPAYIGGIKIRRDLATCHTIPNCHVVARAVAALYPVDLHDGFVFGRNVSDKEARFNHSWLTHTGHDPRIIIDPWPLGIVSGPALFIQDYGFHFGPECSFLGSLHEKFHTDVEATTNALRLVM